MKKLEFALVASLAANIVLLILFWQDRPNGEADLQAAVSAPPAPRPPPEASPDAALSAADTATLIRSQELLATDDLPTLVARLRAAGFPSGVIRGIVSARLAELYGARRKAAVAHQEVVPYWRSSQTFPNDPKAGAAVRALFREQESMLKQLLGPDYAPTDAWSQLIQERKYGYLPAEKVNRLIDILDDYKDLQSAIFGETHGMFLPEDQTKLALVEKERRADIEALLTPEEMEAYDLHTSSVANQLKFQLSAFKPTEEEFRTIYQLTKAANPGQIALAFNSANSNSSGSELRKQIEAALSPDRVDAYRMATNPAYQQIDRLATRLGLADTVAPQVFTTTQDFQQRVRTIQSDSALPAASRASQLAALASEAEAQLTALLGRRGYETYRNQGGQWLNNLK